MAEADTLDAESEATDDPVDKGHPKNPGRDDAVTDEYDEEEDMSKQSDEIAAMLDYIDTLETTNNELLAKVDELAQRDAQTEESILKSADPAVVELVKAAEDRAVAAEAIAKAERDHRLEREFVAKAAGYDRLSVSAEDFGPVLKAAAESMDEEHYATLTQVLDAANEVIKQGAAFNEIGALPSFDADSGMGRIEQAAKQYQAEDATLTREAAIAKAVSEDPTLYDAYLKEAR